MIKLISAIILLAIIITGCKSPQKTVTSQPQPQITTKVEIEETYWKLTELMGKPVLMNENRKKEIHIILQKEGNRVQGFAGCNTIMGRYELKEGSRVTFSGMVSTMLACPDLPTESEFNKMIGTVDNYSINGNIMILSKARMAPMARFEAVVMK